MNSEITRRTFIKGAAAASVLAGPLGALAAEEQKSKPVVVAIVGCAHIHTPQFIDILRSVENLKIKYVWDHDKARAEKRAPDADAKVAGSADDIWSDPEVTMVVIASETNRHRDLAEAAAKAKKHLFIEKPLATNAADAYAIADAIEKAGVLFSTGFIQRSSPHYQCVKEHIGLGSFGKITRVYAATGHSGALEGMFDTEWRWMTDLKQVGKGALGDLGMHSLDLVMWMFGEVESVTGDVRVMTGKYGECDEVGEALVHFKNGVTSTVAGSYVDLATRVTLMVSGTEGHALVEDNHLFLKSSKVEGADGRKMWTKLPRPLGHPLTMLLEVMAGDTSVPLVKPREAADRVKVMDAVYQGVRKKKWVPVT